MSAAAIENQAAHLNKLCYEVVTNSQIERSEIAEKENFRVFIEEIVRKTITDHEQEQAQRYDFPSQSVELKCYGSLSSGFATKDADMDLAIFSPLSPVQPDAHGSPIPRIVEKALLDAGFGARLLPRTRVPIIKVCERPPAGFYQNLVHFRAQWEQGLDPSQLHNSKANAGSRAAEAGKDVGEAKDGAIEAEPPAKDDAKRPKPGAIYFTIPLIQTEGEKEVYLGQNESSLRQYSERALAIMGWIGLRRGFGRHKNEPTFKSEEWQASERISCAFIQGLGDKSLSESLQAYPSLQFATDGSIACHFVETTIKQVEGEDLLRGLGNTSDEQSVMNRWRKLMELPVTYIHPDAFGREVESVLRDIRALPSIQLQALHQPLHQTPSKYHYRAEEIRKQFEDKGVTISQSLLANKYIQGISDETMRRDMLEYMSSRGDQATLSAVATKHKALQLAGEYEEALRQDNIFKEEVADDINAYIRLLRSPLGQVNDGSGATGEGIPVTDEYRSLVQRIQALPDPHATLDMQKGVVKDLLNFPEKDAGVQCDINFSAHLGFQNTILLRCYAHTDPRVRPMILFVKHWAKMRNINSAYLGTLSSYGYVLMVLHYLVNVAQPFVCPNLQQLAPPVPPQMSPLEYENTVEVKGANIRFWRNEAEIQHLAATSQLNRNTSSVGHLIRGFFEYYARSGQIRHMHSRGFDWAQGVISLRTPGGLLSKQSKDWVHAKHAYQGKYGKFFLDKTEALGSLPKGDEVKEVRLRYLLAIEDPFELDHNVARTVTHTGVVAIRDEFRRAWKLLHEAGEGPGQLDELLEDARPSKEPEHSLTNLMKEIHGAYLFE
ncbi:Poly(A) RNA polymerase protein-like protein [Emericellopsis cladophorae]|uniref:polynucleotide adenylyltransferase n=1 Tax=Emericellopsis cladophorae TaxID=2686198 RepID=A0A9Q0BFW3_9HYPO|nr:Poly(A) RNA polymerase protein-like protein [Emericellopsis cladophorae]KAI6782719.1 Poly(A) RNA polymerase protein-like protein [Emericellopsis cladophorae]